MNRAAPLRLASPQLTQLAAPFVASGVLAVDDLAVVDLLAPLYAEADARVLLGLAFAQRAPRLGSVGVDLGAVRERVLAEARAATDDDGGDDGLSQLPWPEAVLWSALTLASPLVGDADGDPRPFVRSGALILARRHWRAQEGLAIAIAERVTRPAAIGSLPVDDGLLRAGLDRLFPPDGTQGGSEAAAAAALAVERSLAVLTGGPGTGKTYAIKNVLALLAEQWLARLGRFPRVSLAAPTGKAAVRLTQGLAEGLAELAVAPPIRAWLEGLQGVTLHRLLGARGTSGGFRYGAGAPLPAEVVVVDEASMVDLPLMARLVEALPEGARLVLAGDPDQLASVGVGSVLADLVLGLEASAARLAAPAVARLTSPRRFHAGSGLGRLAASLAAGDDASLAQAVRWLTEPPDPDDARAPAVTFLPHDDGQPSDELLAAIEHGWAATLQPVLDGPRPNEPDDGYFGRCLRQLEEFRVLAAHRTGPLGVAGLTRVLVQRLAAAAEQARAGGSAPGLARLRPVGDLWTGKPLLVTENRSDLDLRNGDVGLVLPDATGRRRVVFPGKAAGRCLVLDPGRLPAHEPAFVHTVHRAQGSQYQVVCVVLPSRPSPLVTRELVYTAVTRGRERVLLAADRTLVASALAQRVERASTLADRLRHAIVRLTQGDASGTPTQRASAPELP